EGRLCLLSGADERRENYSRLVAALTASPAVTAMLPVAATPNERAWYELGQLLVAAPQADAGAVARRAADWRTRNANHPGAAFLPQSAEMERALAGSSVGAGAADVIALLLPLSGRQQAAGIAVRD